MAIQNVRTGGAAPTANQGADVAKKEGTEEADQTASSQAVRRAGQRAYFAQAATERPSLANAANVTISQRARELALAKSVVAETPDVREDRIQQLKDKIAKGEYTPNVAGIADGIIREAVMEELAQKDSSDQ